MATVLAGPHRSPALKIVDIRLRILVEDLSAYESAQDYSPPAAAKESRTKKKDLAS